MVKNPVCVVTRLGLEGFPDIFDLQYCLNGQSDSNFEWILLLRPSAHNKMDELRQEIQLTSELFNKTKILKVDSDSRGGILNVALESCVDGMVVILDDDDLPLPNFIETINTNAKKSAHKAILRTLTFSQETHRKGGIAGNLQISMTKGIETWPREFELLPHIERNLSPCMSLSFPIKKLKEYDLRWDSTLTAVEDWDFLIRAAQKIPVQSVQVVTSLYRKSSGGYRSQKEVSVLSWKESENITRQKINDLEFIFKVGDLLDNRNWIENHTTLHFPSLPNFYNKILVAVIPILNRFPRTYNFCRTVHRKIVTKMKWKIV